MSDKKLHDVVAYVCKMTKSKSDLSKARLTKLVFLVDWEAAQRYGKQLTAIEWFFNHHGPYVDDVVEMARNDEDFGVVQTVNPYGSLKEQVELLDQSADIALSEEEKEIVTRVIERTNHFYFQGFIDYVYSTYPVKTASRYTRLNLGKIAKKQRQEP